MGKPLSETIDLNGKSLSCRWVEVQENLNSNLDWYMAALVGPDEKVSWLEWFDDHLSLLIPHLNPPERRINIVNTRAIPSSEKDRKILTDQKVLQQEKEEALRYYLFATPEGGLVGLGQEGQEVWYRVVPLLCLINSKERIVLVNSEVDLETLSKIPFSPSEDLPPLVLEKPTPPVPLLLAFAFLAGTWFLFFPGFAWLWFGGMILVLWGLYSATHLPQSDVPALLEKIGKILKTLSSGEGRCVLRERALLRKVVRFFAAIAYCPPDSPMILTREMRYRAREMSDLFDHLASHLNWMEPTLFSLLGYLALIRREESPDLLLKVYYKVDAVVENGKALEGYQRLREAFEEMLSQISPPAVQKLESLSPPGWLLLWSRDLGRNIEEVMLLDEY